MKKRMVSVIVMVALFLNSILGMTEMTYAGTEAIKTKEEAYINKSVKSVTNNGSTTAAITTDGDLYCWGQNDYGQVGNGTIIDQTSPQKVLSNVESVCLGDKNSAAITTDGDLYCWGQNDYGQVGNGTIIDQTSPQKVLSNVESVCLGNKNSAVITTNSDCDLMIFKGNISCYILLLKNPLTLENTKFIAGKLSLKVSLALYLPTGHYKL